MKKTYFNHDSSARNDYRIIKLRAKLGYEGYGIFWALLELLFTEENKLCIDDYETLAYGIQCNSVKVLKSVIEDFDLFVVEDKCFYSRRLNTQINEINSKSLKASENAKKRWNNTDSMQPHTNRNASKAKEDETKAKINKNKLTIVNRGEAFKASIHSIEGISNEDKHNFFLYWSEPNKSNTKMRYELEKTWNLTLRIKRWCANNFNSNKKDTGIKFPDYYDIHFAKRIEQDDNATRQYSKHLESIGYIKEVNTWNGASKWIKK